ncbi:transcription factor BHLH156-like [Typha angustifolia]|uniref:transcription factor BHLH156-like n=1 Tax=Typha angustifolia TaxID=59011 RepID=UPI003C2B1B8A
MDSQHPSLQAHLLSSISNELENNCGDFDQIIADYGHDFDDLMLFGCEFVDGDTRLMSKEAQCEGIDVVSGSPDLSLWLDDSVLLSEGLESFNEGNRDDGDSSTAMKRTRKDRSKTIVAERKRRFRMKEKLYELRSLVPNITKMDKASIIADAVVYVKDLQSEAKKLEEEILMLESSFTRDDQMVNAPKVTQAEEISAVPHAAKILQVNAIEVGDRRFFLTVECEKRDGIAASLYLAIESLFCFYVEWSNSSITADRLVLTLTLNVGEFHQEMDASLMKLWVMGALLKEGFQIAQQAIS